MTKIVQPIRGQDVSSPNASRGKAKTEDADRFKETFKKVIIQQTLAQPSPKIDGQDRRDKGEG
jgi:hypothetical protein